MVKITHVFKRSTDVIRNVVNYTCIYALNPSDYGGPPRAVCFPDTYYYDDDVDILKYYGLYKL